MNSANIFVLKDLTQEFFDLYWNTEKLGCPPIWSEIDTKFRKIPNYNKQGLYAFVKDIEVTYIGVGASKVSDKYPNHGLSSRFQKYCKWIDEANDIYGAKDQRLIDAGAVITIGFEPEHAHLSYALEMFLISRIKPFHNVIGKNSIKNYV